jgi:hypothetical protein
VEALDGLDEDDASLDRRADITPTRRLETDGETTVIAEETEAQRATSLDGDLDAKTDALDRVDRGLDRVDTIATNNAAQLEEITAIVESIAADMPGVVEMRRRRAAAQNTRGRDARPGFFATVVRMVREKIGRVLA